MPVALLLTGGSARTAAISGAATAGLTGLIFVIARLTRLRLPYLDRTEAPPELEVGPAGQFREPEQHWQPPILPSPLAPVPDERDFQRSYIDDHGYHPPLEPEPYGAPHFGSSRYDHIPYEQAVAESATDGSGTYEAAPYERSAYEPAANDLHDETEYDLPPNGPPPYDPLPYEPAPNGTWLPHDVGDSYPPETPDRWPPAADWDPFGAHEDAPHFAEDPRLDLRNDNRRRSRRRAP